MKHTVDPRCNLEQELLRLYKQAAAERRFEVAEHLLCALERMATMAPASSRSVEEAYLFIVPRKLASTIGVDRSPATAVPQNRRLGRGAFQRQEARRIPSREGRPTAPERRRPVWRVAVRRTRM